MILAEDNRDNDKLPVISWQAWEIRNPKSTGWT
jgi:hypothetical protein